MQDETSGPQRFMFEWLNWPRVEVPSFYIDETEG